MRRINVLIPLGVLIILLSSPLFIQSTTGDFDVAAPDPQEIVDAAIKKHGGEKYLQSAVEFDFRKVHFRSERKGGLFVYERSFTKDDHLYQDKLDNGTFSRMVDGKVVALTPQKEKAKASSLNSVIYFALLPYALNDAAVHKKYLGMDQLEGKQYHKVEITFSEEGGGDDHDDKFHYWFDVETFEMKYLAYSFQVHEGGLRFRKAYNTRNVDGILFSDFVNYKASLDYTLNDLPDLFNQGDLEELSKIELEHISVQLLQP